MRIAATLLLFVTLASQAARAHPQQEARPAAPAERPRIVVELSDLLLHSPLVPCDAPAAAATTSSHVRIATWNIQGARSAPVDAIAAGLRDLDADVAALQEVDVRTRRSGFVDQPTTLAAALGLHYVFAGSIKWDEGDYGLALVSRWPLTQVRRHHLAPDAGGEPRIVLDVTLCVHGRPMRILNHHADRRIATRAAGFRELRGIVESGMDQGLLVVGDLNELADAPGVRGLIDAGMVDTSGADSEKTTAGGRIDFILADRITATRMSRPRVWQTDRSDHHALIADVDW